MPQLRPMRRCAAFRRLLQSHEAERPVSVESLKHRPQGVAIGRLETPCPIPSHRRQTAVEQQLQMLGHGWTGQLAAARHLTRRDLALGDEVEDLASGRVG